MIDQVAMAAPAGHHSAAALGAFLASGHPVPSSIAAASQRTRPLRFANMVNILPFRNPLLVAEEAAMLDNRQGAASTSAWGAACARLNSKPSACLQKAATVVPTLMT